MSKECKHEWHAINPFQRICCVCNEIASDERLKKSVKEDFVTPEEFHKSVEINQS